MSKHRKTWSTPEKLKIINRSKDIGVAQASREYNVSAQSIYKWERIYQEKGEEGLSKRQRSEAKDAELRELQRELDYYKKMYAESELKHRIKDEMLKKNR